MTWKWLLIINFSLISLSFARNILSIDNYFSLSRTQCDHTKLTFTVRGSTRICVLCEHNSSREVRHVHKSMLQVLSLTKQSFTPLISYTFKNRLPINYFIVNWLNKYLVYRLLNIFYMFWDKNNSRGKTKCRIHTKDPAYEQSIQSAIEDLKNGVYPSYRKAAKAHDACPQFWIQHVWHFVIHEGWTSVIVLV